MTRSLQAKLLIVAVFVVGLLTGAVLNDVYQTRVQSITPTEASADPERRERPRGPRFEDFLELSEEQRTELDAILKASRERYRNLQAYTQPMYRDLTEQSREEIRAILDEDQLVRYEEWTQRIEELRRGNRGGRRR